MTMEQLPFWRIKLCKRRVVFSIINNFRRLHWAKKLRAEWPLSSIVKFPDISLILSGTLNNHTEITCIMHTNSITMPCNAPKMHRQKRYANTMLINTAVAPNMMLTINIFHWQDLFLYSLIHSAILTRITRDTRNMLSKMSFFVRPKSPISSKFLTFVQI